ncbi:hypothetical protein CCC_01716 [Paramagnetospirillum magnetotacticum MS-1]|uniref:Uncharacterized protein n=1 Tax=Paramagnetospirillum magnetotacticum MS-1 TaxID=272627 RepID=A0A0C2YQA2_PARME|nr:hypothetical protein [Paramagnetospirillum magnetotacticum]KIL96850.1 hypothetical protein CCC_01716 [Paramagnetospirillum magnetotacticum MS-1]
MERHQGADGHIYASDGTKVANGSSGSIHVRSYSRTINGKVVDVAAHERSGGTGSSSNGSEPWQGKSNQKFREKIAEAERSDVHPGGGYDLRNEDGSSALGRYQILEGSLKDAGWKDSQGNWTNKARAQGVGSDQDFLDKPDAQEVAFGDVMRRAEEQATRNGSMAHAGKDYVGPDGSTVPVTAGGVAAAAHREGAGKTHQTLAKLERQASGKAQKFDSADRRVMRRLRQFRDTPYTPGGWK